MSYQSSRIAYSRIVLIIIIIIISYLSLLERLYGFMFYRIVSV
jgi:hypothetical protein